MNWAMVAETLRTEDRCVLPLGCTEQHATLSLATDTHLAARVAAEAADGLGVPVFPALPYGVTPSFTAYPGTVSLRVGTYLALLDDLLSGLYGQGFRRILIVNGHGGTRLGRGGWGSGWRGIRTRGCSGITGGTRRAPGRPCRPQMNWRVTRAGWRTSPGRAWRA
ncbi:creatininase family protein [Deinococcus aquaticus]